MLGFFCSIHYMCNTSDDRIRKYIYPSPPSPIPHPFRTFNHRSENNENAYRRDVALVATSASPTTWCPPSSSRGVAARRPSSLSTIVASCTSGHTSPATGTPRVAQGGGAAVEFVFREAFTETGDEAVEGQAPDSEGQGSPWWSWSGRLCWSH